MSDISPNPDVQEQAPPARFTGPVVKADQLSVEAGRVPARFLLGRAFFVYWPAGFRPAQMMPALAPDFGDMRFIR